MSILKNYASREYLKRYDTEILEELKNAGIPILELPNAMSGETKSRYIGLLNGFVFIRAWRYWVCTGDMPLADAENIYRDYHHLAVRADGHAGSPEPKNCCYNPVHQAKEREVVAAMKAKGATTQEMIAALEALEEDLSLPRYVRCYHIDTTEGLEALADYIARNNVYAHNGAPGSYTASVFRGEGI